MKTLVLANSVALLGWWEVVVPLQVIIAAVAFSHGRRRFALFCVVAPLLAALTVTTARAVVDWHPAGFGRVDVVLPSGHSALGVVAVTTLALLARADGVRLWLRLSAAAVTILAVAAVMVLAGHTVGDVVVGVALGGLSVLGAGLVSGLARLSRSATTPASPAR